MPILKGDFSPISMWDTVRMLSFKFASKLPRGGPTEKPVRMFAEKLVKQALKNLNGV